MSDEERLLSPTYLALGMRRQWSDEHLFEESDLYRVCARCYRRRSHPDHVTRDEDRAEVRRWADRIRAEQDQ